MDNKKGGIYMKLKISLLAALFIMLLLFTGCGQSDPVSPESDADVIGEWTITVEVVGEDSFEFTNEDAAAIGPVEIVAVMKDKDTVGEEETWIGITFMDFLDYIDVDEFSVVVVEAADGYSRELEPDRVSENGTGLGWMVNGEVLDEERGPVQLINHDRGPNWWVKQVAKITVIK